MTPIAESMGNPITKISHTFPGRNVWRKTDLETGFFWNQMAMKKLQCLVGGWALGGMAMTFPTEWKVIKTMFQTTNQMMIE